MKHIVKTYLFATPENENMPDDQVESPRMVVRKTGLEG